jgi:acetyl-CoA carboxylase alpha subunit
MKKVPKNKEKLKEKIKRLEETYSEALKRKDEEIEKLRKDNIMIFKASMKQVEKMQEMQNALKKALEENRKLRLVSAEKKY